MMIELGTNAPDAGMLCRLLSRYRLACGTEERLQSAMRSVFDENLLAYEAEFELTTHDRIDFFVPNGLLTAVPRKWSGVGIECKVGGSLSALTRQLFRYAESELVKELVVVTTRQAHRGLPEAIQGKPVLVHAILAGIG